MGKRGRAWRLERAHVGGKFNRSNKYSNSDASPTPKPGSRSRYWVGSFTRKDGTKVKGHYRVRIPILRAINIKEVFTMPRKSEEVHNRLIRALVNRYKEDGYTNIKADHISHPNGAPEPVNGYRPDISAEKGNTYVIAEAETCDTIGTQETLDQWRAFDTSWKEFHVIVPKRCLE